MDRRIVIVGFMGCGKTTVAQALATRLECGMVDLDSVVSLQAGMSVPDIITKQGEAGFRDAETSALQIVLDRLQPRIIALGGGAWTLERNRELIREHECLTVFLDAPFELCWERIAASPNTIRPLAPDRETAQRLHESRRTSYLLAQLRVDARKELAEIISDITRRIS